MPGEDKRRLPRDTPLAQAALGFYRDALHRSDGWPQYHEYLGEYLYAIGRDEEALEAWRSMAKPPQDSVENLKRLGEVLAGVGMLDEAIASVERAAAKENDREDLHLLAVDLLERAKKYDEAIEHVAALEKLADTPYAEELALGRRVQIYAAGGRLQSEGAALAKTLEQPGATWKDRWLAALIAVAERRWEEAGGLLERALKEAPGDVRLRKLKARVHAESGDLAAAAAELQELARLEPRSRTTYLQELVKIDMDLGRGDEAAKAAEEVIKSSPARVDGYTLLAEIQFRRGQTDAGLETLRKAVRVDPRDVEVRVLLARSLAQDQRLDEAIEHDWRAFELVDDLTGKIGIMGSLADLYLAQGKFEGLADKLRQLRRAQEDQTMLTLCLIEAYRHAEDFESARRELADLLVRRPNDVQVLEQLLALAEAMQDLEEAEANLQKIVAIAPDRSNLERLARYYTQRGKKDEASALWDRLAREANDVEAILASIDRAARDGDFRLAASLAHPQWARRPDDWRFGYRLAQAYGALQQANDGRAVYEAILKLPPNEIYEKSPQGASKSSISARQRSPLGLRAQGYPSFWQMNSLLNQVRQISQGYITRPVGSPPPRPDSLDEAQMMSLIALHEDAIKRKQEGPWLDALKRRSETDPSALRQLVMLQFSANKLDGVGSLIDRWIERSPADADARLARLSLDMRVDGPEKQKFTKVNLAGVKRDYDWFVTRRPDLVRWIMPIYAQILNGSGNQEATKAFLRESIEKSHDPGDLNQLAYLVSQTQDLELFETLQARVTALQPQSSSSGMSGPNLFPLYLQLAAQKQEWDKVVDAFDRTMSAPQPRSAQPVLAMQVPPSGAYATSFASLTHARLARSAAFRGQPSWMEGEFPTATVQLDQSRLQVLQETYQALKPSDNLDRLTELAEKRAKASSGAARRTWQLVRSYIAWWEGYRAESLEQMDKIAADAPADVEIRLAQARAHAVAGEAPQALAAIESIHVPFGRAAKPLEQFRLQLAERASNDAVARQAALRLFGMRLAAHEQVELAQTLRRLGLTTQSQQLEQRAEVAARSNPNLLLPLIQQHVQTDPARAVSLARTLLLQTRRSNSPNDSVTHIRLQALQTLRQLGELEKMITQAEKQLAAAPNSFNLIEDLAEYYEGMGDQA
ncbi:MAG TPA: tetratricopeptide repeat protein, partial [Isosphaeraceae bacterium]|nr:tetratricopeptide repeat protein [Isosphaeraceae bacterium]